HGVVAALAGLALAAVAAPVRANSVTALEGSWTVAQATVNGALRADGKVLNATWTFRGPELVMQNANGERLRPALSFDSTGRTRIRRRGTARGGRQSPHAGRGGARARRRRLFGHQWLDRRGGRAQARNGDDSQVRGAERRPDRATALRHARARSVVAASCLRPRMVLVRTLLALAVCGMAAVGC